MPGHENTLASSVEGLLGLLVNKMRSTCLFNSNRLKLVLIATLCITLGYIVTASFEPANVENDIFQTRQGSAADLSKPLDGLSDYSGTSEAYGYTKIAKDQSSGRLPTWDDELDDSSTREHSISDALSDLHYAVSNRLSSWKPWYLKDQAKSNASSLTGPSTAKLAAMTRPALSEELIAPGRDMLGHRTIVGKCTIVLYGSAIYERAVRTHGAHDRINGYPLHVLRQSIMDDVWSKPAYILSLLLKELSKPETERLQWLLWIDADTIVLNPYIPIEIFLPPSPEFDDIHLMVTHDWNGLNNGVFPIRVCQWSVDLLSAIVAFRHYRPDTELTFRDQSAMDILLHEKKFSAHTVEAPQRWFNAYQGEHNETLAPFQVRRGDFLVHFAGVGNRDERILYWLDRAEQHLPDWEMEAQHTTYPTEVRDFWVGKADERKSRAMQVLEMRKEANELIFESKSKMSDYQDRIQEDDRANVLEQQKALTNYLEVDEKDSDVKAIQQAMAALSKSLLPLDEVIERAHKVLMKEAHEAIFSAEEDLLQQAGASNPEVNTIELKTAELKDLVLQPIWRTEQMNMAIEAVRQARLRLQEKLHELEVQKQELQETRANTEEDRQQEAASTAAQPAAR